MASEQLGKVIERIKSQPQNLNASMEQRRAGMERISERVPADVSCEKVDAGGVKAEWIAAPGAAAVEDATASYKWLLAQGYQPGKIVIAGDSAGGGLTLAALLAIRDGGLPLPSGAVPISPWTDLEGTGESVRSRAAKDVMVTQDNLASSAKQYHGAHDPRDPLVSPLHANFRGLPPMLIQVGDAEILLDDATRVAARAKEAGVQVELEVWDEMPHVWHVFAKLLPEGQQAIDKIGKFVIALTS